MNRGQFEEYKEDFERKFDKYQAHCKAIPGCIERGEFHTAALQLKIAEGLFSDGLFEELNHMAKESNEIDPPEIEMDIIRDSDGHMPWQ